MLDTTGDGLHVCRFTGNADHPRTTGSPGLPTTDVVPNPKQTVVSALVLKRRGWNLAHASKTVASLD